MPVGRRLAVLGATLASAMSLASLATPAPASAARPEGTDGPRPLTNLVQPVAPGVPQWVSLGWTTDRRVCHVRVRVRGGRFAGIAYPGNRRYTSFSRGDGLQPGRIDHTSFRVTANEEGPGPAFLTATVDYDYCRPGSPTMNDAIGFWVPVRV
jgi:hypothetical protein